MFTKLYLYLDKRLKDLAYASKHKEAHDTSIMPHQRLTSAPLIMHHSPVKPHLLLFISEVWHGADAETDHSDQHHDDRQTGEYLPSQPRVRVLHDLAKHPHHFLISLSDLCALLHSQFLLPPLLVFALPLSLVVHSCDHSATTAPLHVARVHTPVVQLIVEGHGAQFTEEAQFTGC